MLSRPIANPDIDLILFDCNYIGHTAKYATRRLTLHGAKYAIAYQFLKTVISVCHTLRCGHSAFIWDTKYSLRKDVFPWYKGKRAVGKDMETQRLNESAYAQFELLKTRMLPDLNLSNIMFRDGFEADDLIASICQHENQKKIVIVSADGDLYQCLKKNVSIYDFSTGIMLTEEKFKKNYDITPDRWAEVKAIGGCVSDNIPGIVGVGELKAIQYLNGKMNPKTKSYKSIISGEDKIREYLILTKLPLEGTPDITWFDISKHRSTKKHFVDVCSEYKFQSMLTREFFTRWEGLFCG